MRRTLGEGKRRALLATADRCAGRRHFPPARQPLSQLPLQDDHLRWRQTFSSVRQVTKREAISIVDSGGVTLKSKLAGEAVVLDFPGRKGPVFALLSRPGDPDYARGIAGAALRPVRDEGGDLNGYARWMQHMVAVKGPMDLPRTKPNHDPRRGPREIDLWPMFVAFSDPSNPASVREVSPDDIGVERITIEITDEPVTNGIEKRLPWLHEYYDRKFSGARFETLGDIEKNGVSASLSSGAFSAGNGLSPHDDDND